MSKRYTLTNLDKSAIYKTAKNLGVDPYEFAAVLEQESGVNPNIWGGQGGGYYGVIQFGGPERAEAGLNPEKIGSYTVAEQLPHVEKWLRGRGFESGMGTDKLYATILGGNPEADIYAKDSFGTSVADSLNRFYTGGSLNKIARQKLGDLPQENLTINNYYSVEEPKKETKKKKDPFEQLMLGQLLRSVNPTGTTGYPFQQMLGAIQRQGNDLADNLVKQYQSFGGLR
ncbi:MAG: hypothetical protein GY920_10695 [Aliivibrio sp.]|nr:hypothetical protein [Aliivibrio sp.]